MVEPKGNALIPDLVEGREHAFAALYDQLGPSLFRTARLLLGSVEEAEDAVQDVFVGLVRARQQLSKVDDLRAYLFAALRHATARSGEPASTRPVVSRSAGADGAVVWPGRRTSGTA